MSEPTLDLDELEKIARAATPGPWVVFQDEVVDGEGRRVFVSYGLDYQRNASFAAAANPQTVLALIQMARNSYTRALRDVKEGMQVAGRAGVRSSCARGCEPPFRVVPGCLVHDPTAPVPAVAS